MQTCFVLGKVVRLFLLKTLFQWYFNVDYKAVLSSAELFGYFRWKHYSSGTLMSTAKLFCPRQSCSITSVEDISQCKEVVGTFLVCDIHVGRARSISSRLFHSFLRDGLMIYRYLSGDAFSRQWELYVIVPLWSQKASMKEALQRSSGLLLHSPITETVVCLHTEGNGGLF